MENDHIWVFAMLAAVAADKDPRMLPELIEIAAKEGLKRQAAECMNRLARHEQAADLLGILREHGGEEWNIGLLDYVFSGVLEDPAYHRERELRGSRNAGVSGPSAAEFVFEHVARTAWEYWYVPLSEQVPQRLAALFEEAMILRLRRALGRVIFDAVTYNKDYADRRHGGAITVTDQKCYRLAVESLAKAVTSYLEGVRERAEVLIKTGKLPI